MVECVYTNCPDHGYNHVHKCNWCMYEHCVIASEDEIYEIMDIDPEFLWQKLLSADSK